MKRDLIHEMIQLKERRKILEAELGVLHEDAHIFSRQERNEIKAHLNQENIQIILEAINERLREDEMLYQRMLAAEMSLGRVENWNRELEGIISRDSIMESGKLYERENIFN